MHANSQLLTKVNAPPSRDLWHLNMSNIGMKALSGETAPPALQLQHQQQREATRPVFQLHIPQTSCKHVHC
jgi:hypothetical protein